MIFDEYFHNIAVKDPAKFKSDANIWIPLQSSWSPIL